MKDKYQLKDREDELWEERSEDEGNAILRAQCGALGFLRGETDPVTDAEMETSKTDEDLDKLIAQLQQEKENIREYSAFGDPNWQMLDAQIEICEWAKGK